MGSRLPSKRLYPSEHASGDVDDSSLIVRGTPGGVSVINEHPSVSPRGMSA